MQPGQFSLLESPEQLEADRVRERNRLAKRASRARRRQQLSRDGSVDNGTALLTPSQKLHEIAARPSEQRQDSHFQKLSPPESTHPAAALPRNQNDEEAATIQSLTSDLSGYITAPEISWGDEWTTGEAAMATAYGSCDDVMTTRSRAHSEAPHWPTSTTPNYPFTGGTLGDMPEMTPESMSLDQYLNQTPMRDDAIKPSRLVHIAVQNGSSSILRKLVDAGADINWPDEEGSTPLHLAVRFRRAAMVEVLAERGVKINALNAAGMTALEMAVRSGYEDIVDMLLSFGARVT